MFFVRPNYRTSAAFFLIGLPILALALNAFSWLRYGLDLPFLDDWAEYYTQSATSLSFGHLFASGNDTVYPVGRLLDVMAQKFLSGNGIAYQFISMVVVLGSLLSLQWCLLRETVYNPLIRASAFGLCVFMICPYTYWGLQNIAYVQALPTIGILLLIFLIISPSEKTTWRLLTMLVVGILSGLSYISGAVVILGMGLFLLSIAAINRQFRERRLLQYGIALVVAGAATTAVQFGDIIIHQAGRLHRPDAHWVMPYESDYWMYLFGKIGRAASLQNLPASVSIWIVLLLTLTMACIFINCTIILILTEKPNQSGTKIALIYCILFVSIFLYLNMLAASRAKLRPENISTSIDIFRFGFENRFHFFWVTLLFPWLGVIVYRLTTSIGRFKMTGDVALVLSLFCVVLGYHGGIFGYRAEYAGLSAMRAADVQCIQDKISARKPIACSSVFPGDLTKAFLYARSIEASFTRYFPFRSYSESDSKSGLIFRLIDTPTAVKPSNTAMRRSSSGDFEFTPGVDPQVHILVPSPKELSSCLVVQFSALVSTSTPDVAQLFYSSPNEPYYSEAKSQRKPLSSTGNDFTRLVFIIDNLNGFNKDFRFDVVESYQNFTIRDIELACLIKN